MIQLITGPFGTQTTDYQIWYCSFYSGTKYSGQSLKYFNYTLHIPFILFMVWWVRALGVSLMIHPSMVALVSSKHLPMTILFHQLTGEAREKNPVSNNTRWFRACCTISLFAWFATKLFFFSFLFLLGVLQGFPPPALAPQKNQQKRKGSSEDESTGGPDVPQLSAHLDIPFSCSSRPSEAVERYSGRRPGSGKGGFRQ